MEARNFPHFLLQGWWQQLEVCRPNWGDLRERPKWRQADIRGRCTTKYQKHTTANSPIFNKILSGMLWVYFISVLYFTVLWVYFISELSLAAHLQKIPRCQFGKACHIIFVEFCRVVSSVWAKDVPWVFPKCPLIVPSSPSVESVTRPLGNKQEPVSVFGNLTIT